MLELLNSDSRQNRRLVHFVQSPVSMATGTDEVYRLRQSERTICYPIPSHVLKAGACGTLVLILSIGLAWFNLSSSIALTAAFTYHGFMPFVTPRLLASFNAQFYVQNRRTGEAKPLTDPLCGESS